MSDKIFTFEECPTSVSVRRNIRWWWKGVVYEFSCLTTETFIDNLLLVTKTFTFYGDVLSNNGFDSSGTFRNFCKKIPNPYQNDFFFLV